MIKYGKDIDAVIFTSDFKSLNLRKFKAEEGKELICNICMISFSD